jgi:hypothetical protein
MTPLVRLFKKISCTNSKPLEIVLIVQSILFGVFLLVINNAFVVTPVYHVLALILPEGAWGLIFVSMGMLQLLALNNATGRLRGTCSMIALFLWLIVDISAWLSNSSSAATVSYLTFVMMAAWCVIAISTKEYFNCDH